MVLKNTAHARPTECCQRQTNNVRRNETGRTRHIEGRKFVAVGNVVHANEEKNRYELGNAVTLADPSAHAMFPMSAYLGHVDFGYDADDKLFYLNDPTQLERFILDSANAQVQPGKGDRTVAEVQADIERRAENAQAPWDAVLRVTTGTKSRPT